MNAIMQIVSLAGRLVLAWLFIYASYDKVWNPEPFAMSVARYELLPVALINVGSVLLAWLELLVGLMLLLGLWTRTAALWATGLLAMFTGLMLYAWVIGAGYDCGCFPGHGEEHQAGLEAAFRDLAFMVPAVWLLWRPGGWLSLRTGEPQEQA